MSFVSRGFSSRSKEYDSRIPPGQHLTDDFPVLSTGPTPRVDFEDWTLEITDVDGSRSSLDWQQLMSLPIQDIVHDIHCVTNWSKLNTSWRGVCLDDIIGPLDSEAEFALIHSYGGYSTNLPLDDLLDGKAWVVFEYEGEELEPEHGGPARLLVPHLYLWKSAKWISEIELRSDDQLGFWESHGYHEYGDPWLEQRYDGD